MGLYVRPRGRAHRGDHSVIARRLASNEIVIDDRAGRGVLGGEHAFDQTG